MKSPSVVLSLAVAFFPAVLLAQEGEGTVAPPEWSEPEPPPPAETDPTLPADLTQFQRRLFEACRGDLLFEEKAEFARLEPGSRGRWLKAFCDQRSPYLKCRKRLTDEQRRLYLVEPLERRVPWLRDHCKEAPPDPLFARKLTAQEAASLPGSNRRVYEMCNASLTIDQRTYYLEAPALERQHLLTDWCGVAPTAVATAPMSFDFRPAPGPRFVESAMERHSWPASRIVAHALFWPGVIFLVGGLIAGGIVDFDFPEIWAPPLAIGAGLTLGGIGGGLRYLSWKKGRE
jgi:hypothetical protein